MNAMRAIDLAQPEQHQYGMMAVSEHELREIEAGSAAHLTGWALIGAGVAVAFGGPVAVGLAIGAGLHLLIEH